jgi:hypothetical protein
LFKFKVRPTVRSKWWYDVLVYDTKKEMLKEARELYIKVFGHNCRKYVNGAEAITFGYSPSDKKKKNKLGDILFYKGYLGAGVVSHEMVHAAVYCHKEIRVNLNKLYNSYNDDERFADTVGYLNAQFWRKYRNE